ncbi:efflux RND transporter periplasmic adaptor subunit [Rhizosphaericola mali]|uniref:Efflux RND transporter periplasmic adaptor subunit n=1 Tax=Rhizosphaericola mali TaxID=2545455 RepID=A0A5P2FVV7_9BACT|nr:efflux RND transporter periplasmic adaptor subunit [Rhizosphaericola mali]QES87644.1 efflux RND transporter periplasmic adaptor subunit [Rhizosphaericola mali]
MKIRLSYLMTITVIILSSCNSGEQPTQQSTAPEIPIAVLHKSDEVVYTEYPAKMEGLADIEIRPQVNGILEHVFVDEGSFVKKGTLLFQIDSRPYLEAYNNAQAELWAANAEVSTTQIELEKLNALVKSKVYSNYQLKIAEMAFDAATARKKQAIAKVGNAKITLGYTQIKAPMHGYIGRIGKKGGSLVAPSDPQPLSYLSDNKNVRAYFSIGEKEFVSFKNSLTGNAIGDKLKQSPPVTMVLPGGLEYAHAGKLDMVDAMFDNRTGAITLRATFPNTEGSLRSGNSGKVRLGIKENGIFKIPQSATFEMQDKVFAFVVDRNNKVHQIALSITGTTEDSYYISKGLNDGDRLVLKGMEALKDGAAIHPEIAKENLTKN